MAALTSSDGTTFTINYPMNSATSSITTNTSISNSGGYANGSSINGACIHGIWGHCYTCNPIYSQQCTCAVFGSACPIHTAVINAPPPSWVNWPPAPPAPPAVDLHAKEGHAVTHEMVTNDKGLKIVFKCCFCQAVIYKKYLIRIPRKVREEKCLVRVLNYK